MHSTVSSTGVKPQQRLKRVATNLYRSDITGIYYCILKAGRKQYHRSLKTTDRAIAERRLADKREGLRRLSAEDGRKLLFAEFDENRNLVGGLVKRWYDVIVPTVEPCTSDGYLGNIGRLAIAFFGLTARAISLRHVEDWNKRRVDCSASTFNKELGVLRWILDHGIEHGLLLDNPARKIKRLYVVSNFRARRNRA